MVVVVVVRGGGRQSPASGSDSVCGLWVPGDIRTWTMFRQDGPDHLGMRALHQAGMHGTTFGGNPLACAVGHKVMEIIKRDELAANAYSVRPPGTQTQHGVAC